MQGEAEPGPMIPRRNLISENAALLAPAHRRTCFFESDPSASLASRVLAEGVGTFLLMTAIVGAGVISHRAHDSDALVALAVGATTIAGTLSSLIVALGAVSGGHFNPLITGIQCLAHERRAGCTAAYVLAQLAGGLLGALLAGTIFNAPLSPASAGEPSTRILASEALAAAGLMIIVLGCAKSRRTETGPFAVGAWLAGAIVVMPSGSYANPAVALALCITVGPTHLNVVTAASYVAVEILGARLAFMAIRAMYPRETS